MLKKLIIFLEMRKKVQKGEKLKADKRKLQ